MVPADSYKVPIARVVTLITGARRYISNHPSTTKVIPAEGSEKMPVSYLL